MTMRVFYVGEDQAIAFAAVEVKRVLEEMDPGLEIALCGMTENEDLPGLWLGTYGGLDLETPSVDNPVFDDAYLIETHDYQGVIAATNPRSVLLAVYRYLRELGCAWIRPGKDGEIIPKISLKGTSVKVNECASYRHRGVCIEGAVNYDHVNEMVKWLPKIGMNAYFNQFWTPFTFYDRWYRHTDNPKMKPEPVSVQEVDGFVRSQMDNVRSNDMLYHATGHGWTCIPFGVEGLGWYVHEGDLPEGYLDLVALVDGKRELFGGIALNTNLCYTNPKARKAVIDAIVDYCRRNQDVDFLHFWLADAINSHCECEECVKQRPSDNYVDLLNELDECLTQQGISTRIVFLLYFDLLWAPEKKRLKNQDRFVLQFAPISRTYSNSYLDNEVGRSTSEPFPFQYNQLQLPRSVEENLTYLRAWQQQFQGDSFVFDYHLWRDHLRDVGYAQIAKVLFQDIQGLERMGLNGMMSCQAQRVFFPSALPMLLMADALWDNKADYEARVTLHYKAMYGESWQKVRAYLEEVSNLFDSAYLRQEKEAVSEQSRRGYEKAEDSVRAFQPFIEGKLDLPSLHPAVKKSYFILKYHAQLAILLAAALKNKAAGQNDKAEAAWEVAAEYARNHEHILHEAFDVYEFINVVGASIIETQWQW